jgi:hypothetical protein
MVPSVPFGIKFVAADIFPLLTSALIKNNMLFDVDYTRVCCLCVFSFILCGQWDMVLAW